MNCHESEKLKSYAYCLLDEAAAADVRAHLGKCPHCREMVEQYGRLGAVLDEWKTVQPTPGFDARVRFGVEAQGEKYAWWNLWNWDLTQGLALVSLGLLIFATAVLFTRGLNSISNSSRVATRTPHPSSSAPTPAQVAKLQHHAVTPSVRVAPPESGPTPNTIDSAGGLTNDDKDTQALEDYDLAANFDLLSELPRGQARVAN